MDEFAWIVSGGLLALVLGLLAIGRWYPGSGAEVLDWKPTRSYEAEAEMELQDVEDMLEAANARRRARGQRELTEDDIHARIAEDRRERDAITASLREEQDLEELLELANSRRLRRGEPPLTAEQLRAELEAGGEA